MNINEFMDTLVDVCHHDEEFLRRSRYVDGNVRLGIGAMGFVLRFCGGQLIDIVPDASTVKWDYEVVGPESDWARIWRGEIDIMQALMPKYSALTIRGDRVKYGADIQTIAHMTRLMPAAAAKLGVHVRPMLAPPEGDSGPWVTRHDVIGRYVEVGGVRTYYETMGKKGSVTFLGMHSAGRDCRQWQQMGDCMGHVGQMVALDLPGHGKSWPLAGGQCLTSPDEIAAFIWAFRNAAGFAGPTVVLGCSLGGKLVYQLAAEHPDEVVALVSFQGSAFTPSLPEWRLLLMDHPSINPAYHTGEQACAVIGKNTAQRQRDYLKWEVATVSSAANKSDMTAYFKFDFRERMQEVRCPALLIRGLDDFLVDADLIEDTAKRLVNARVLEVVMPEGLGHYSHVEQPPENARIVLDFLSRNGVISS